MLLERLPASSLAFFHKAYKCLLGQCLWIHGCSWHSLDRIACGHLPTRRELLALWVQAKTCCLTLREGNLYGTKLLSSRDKNAFLVHVVDSFFGSLEGADPYECASSTRSRSCRIDQEHLQNFAEFLECLRETLRRCL